MKPIADNSASGIAVFPTGAIGEYIPFLQTQLTALFDETVRLRPWHLWDLHNPWGRSAHRVDSWTFLDLCQAPELLALIAPLIGPDIILYDSQFAPDISNVDAAEDAWQCDALRCPVEPLAGLTVRIPCGIDPDHILKFCYRREAEISGQTREEYLESGCDHIICHDVRLSYRIEGAAQLMRPCQYVIRYFPATSRYLRDPTAKAQQALIERYPLLNYARMPLWLAHGEDRADNDFVTGFQLKSGRWIEDREVT